ncbi:MAG: GNAT family N-acetyltransferase [Anaeromicrobium sp.]|jgi:GNAT superfamily N-acetyltransferase|uniref:GNAT family N-acetyltransferase n=1 Tax=Anaeromicrobium sp. TaxID=1929132 RepID=UPI0025CC0F84|nr:GNAT family N-acetyltransferase [Anaeromicrobium sp.]MCT4595881.1 GNAT family N-acetyltransferase [Anaeromicrobium sp.]
MNIRVATVVDVPHIAYINVETWLTTYRGIVPDKFLKERKEKIEEIVARIGKKLKENNMKGLVCEEGDKIVGFATYGRERDDDLEYKGELYAIYVLETYQKKGLGKEILKGVVRNLISMGINKMLIWVLEENKSCRFYEKSGGKIVKRRNINIGGKKLKEVGYGWNNLKELQRTLK